MAEVSDKPESWVWTGGSRKGLTRRAEGFPLDAFSRVSLRLAIAARRASSRPRDDATIQPSNAVDLKELRKIIELMNEHGLTYFDMSKDGFHLKLKKGQDLDSLRSILSALPSAAPAMVAAPVAAAPAAGPAAPAAAPVADGEAITSPMVGTFYRKPSPDAPMFVNVGDTISEGQTICIIEAMKVMNEIKAERAGTITAILVDDATPVQFGDAMFTIK